MTTGRNIPANATAWDEAVASFKREQRSVQDAGARHIRHPHALVPDGKG